MLVISSPNSIRSFVLSGYIVVNNEWFRTVKRIEYAPTVSRYIMRRVIDTAHPFISTNKNFIGRIIQKR